MRRTCFILLLAVTSALAATARANETIVPVRGRILDAPRWAEAGTPFEAVLELRVHPGMTLGAVVLDGGGWTIETGLRTEELGEPNRNGRRGTVVRIPFRATASDPERLVTVQWEVNGREGSQTLDFSRRAFEENRPEMALIAPEGGSLAEAREPETWFRHPSFDRADGMGFDAVREAGTAKADPGASPQSGTVTVTGFVATVHGDADGVLETVYMRQATVLVSAWSGGYVMGFPAIGTTDDTGHFSITFSWGWPTSEVNVQVLAAASNAHAQVEDVDWYGNQTWSMQSDVLTCPINGSVSAGLMIPATAGTQKAFYIAEFLQRCWEYFYYIRGIDVDHVEVEWPVYDGSKADTDDNLIYIDAGDGYHEATIAHEYGHHLHDQTAFKWDPNDVSDYYCNPGGYCDDGDCGHCQWLPESGKVAWNEGLATFFGNLATEYIDAVFSTPGKVDLDQIETIGTDSRLTDPDPTLTEGYVSAVLWDLHDSNGSDDDQKFPGKADRVDGYTEEIFTVLNSVCNEYGLRPRYITWYLDCFKNTYPEIKEEIWETCRNNGYEIDEEESGLPHHLYSTPAVNTPSTKSTVVVYWSEPDDDASGVAGYAYSWTRDAPALPNLTNTIGDVTMLVEGPLEPGNWYFNLRPIDRANHIHSSYTSLGPIILEDLTDADLAPDVRAGWDYEVVPRNAGDATINDVQVSSNLVGDQTETYWNVAGENVGTQASPITNVAVTVDGTVKEDVSFEGLAPGNSTVKLNRGPIRVRGGRHIFGMILDEEGAFPEPDETDNYRAGQWAWSPYFLTPGTAYSHAAPPPIEAGLFGFGWDQPYHYNCIGYEAPYTIFHQAVWMYPQSPGRDYDLQLFNGASTPEAGFITPQAFSDRPADCLEALIWNPFVEGYVDHNVGVYNVDTNDATAPHYLVRRIEAENLGGSFGNLSRTLRYNDMLDLFTFYADSPTGGIVDFTIYHEHAYHTIYAATFDETFARGNLLDGTQIVEVPADNPVSLQVTIPVGKMALLAVWQEPTGDYKTSTSYELGFESGLPDLAAETPEFWVRPLVPRDVLLPNYPFTFVNHTAHLDGEGGPTYLFMSTLNDSNRDAPAHDRIVYLDGEVLAGYAAGSISKNTFFKTRDNTPYYIPGGRHTLAMHLDTTEVVDERSELNNTFADQWVWTPPELTWGSSRVFSTPPWPDGGWEDLPDTLGPEDMHYYNCLGFRKPLPLNGERWAAVYAGGGYQTNVDLRLHEPATGSRTGFQEPLVQSTASGTTADFIVIDRDVIVNEVLDVGIVRTEGDAGGKVQCEEAQTTPLAGPGTYGPFTMPRNDLIDVHNLRLDTGIWTIRLVPDRDNAATLGMCYTAFEDGYGTFFSSGETAGLTPAVHSSVSFDVTVNGMTDAPLVIWRANSTQGGASALYRIVVEASTNIGVGDGLDPAARLLAAAPNPFASSTRIAFRLEEAGYSRLTVYDMRGAAIRVLREGDLPAGVHEVAWDGRDDRGSRAASGLYFLRLETPAAARSLKLILVR